MNNYSQIFQQEIKCASLYYNSWGMNVMKIFRSEVGEYSFNPSSINYQKQQTAASLINSQMDDCSGIALITGWNKYHAITVHDIHDLDSSYFSWLNNLKDINGYIVQFLKELRLPVDYPWVIINKNGTGFSIIFTSEAILTDIHNMIFTPWGVDVDGEKIKHFQKLELEWDGHILMPPTEINDEMYYFRDNIYPESSPLNVNLSYIDLLIADFIHDYSFNQYKNGTRVYELYEKSAKFFTYKDYCNHNFYDNLEWIKQCNTRDSLDALGIAYALGRGVEVDKAKAVKYFKSADYLVSYFNLASLIAGGVIEGTLQDVRYYLDKIRDDIEFVDLWTEDEDGNIYPEINHCDLIYNNAEKYCCREQLYLFFDTETTGIPNDYNAPSEDTNNWPRLVQIAWLITRKNGDIYKELQSRIISPEGFRIPQSSINIHGITQEKAVEDGEDLCNVLNDFVNDVDDNDVILVGHNIYFDIHVVTAELIRNDMIDEKETLEKINKICTMKKSTDFCKISGLYGYKYPKLQQLYYKLFGENFDNAHDAGSDIEATRKCFFELKRRGIL